MGLENKRNYFCDRFKKNYIKGERLWSHLDNVSKTFIKKVALDVWRIKDTQKIT